MVADFETVVAWFEKARDNAAKMGKHESALLWSDGLAHLVRMESERDTLAKRVEALEKLLLDWRHEYGNGSIEREASRIATRRAGRAS